MGGHAKVVVDTIEQNGDYDILGFVDGKDKLGMSYNGYNVIGTDDNLDTLKNFGGVEEYCKIAQLLLQSRWIRRKPLYHLVI